ncbi:MAG: response regulator [Cyanobacteria bacterium P01_A01_bin.105]
MTKILVIEDEAQVRENLKEILQLNGFTTITADSGFKALPLIKEHFPNLILCDVMMPGLSGHEVLEKVRQDEAVAAIPFVFLTAKADPHDLRQGMNMGADDYLTKPFEAKELLDAVQSRLNRCSSVQQAATTQAEANQHLTHALNDSQRQMTDTQKIADLKDELLGKISAELREPLSNINMAIQMLQRADSHDERTRYIRILKEEYAREMTLLSQVDSLRLLLTPDNAKLLQSFDLLGR